MKFAIGSKESAMICFSKEILQQTSKTLKEILICRTCEIQRLRMWLHLKINSVFTHALSL